ncbi:hypothetical protein J11TS1_02170 [Oceanobacillus sp. J11TS1]|nr:hypothetical protein J11TS1_02170 [Oceanobacillus sp. J11TS1]
MLTFTTGISATTALSAPVGLPVAKSSLSYGGEGSLASRWALELDVAAYVTKLYTAFKFYNFL